MTQISIWKVVLLAIFISAVCATPSHIVSEPLDLTSHQTAVRVAAPVVPTITSTVGDLTIVTNTTTNNVTIQAPVDSVVSTSVSSTVLIFARDSASAYSALSGLNGYAIPYQLIVVPQTGVTLPVLNSSTVGNFGAIVVLSEVSYDYGGKQGFQSALNASQWAALYQYQISFGVRMVRLDVFPGPNFGTKALGGCCAAGVEQLISISNDTTFPNAGLNIGAGVTTVGLWHYPASITNPAIATEFAQFAPATGFPTASTAGVINNIGGRQQMVFFTGFATDWSYTSNFLQHAWIQWVTRGLYTGYRRVNLNTQVDDMFLESDMYSPDGTTYQITPDDLDQHITWMADVNSRLPDGSDYFLEVGHNGNGNIEDAEDDTDESVCGMGSIEYPDQIDTPLEFMKPLDTGKDLWPSNSTVYPYTTDCTNSDALLNWWADPDNLNAFAHVSHTFTHEDENNATYFDVSREIIWNQAWLAQVGIADADKFCATCLIPPGITGLHNGDALRAWVDAGIVHVVGDNTRPVLMNQINEMWPLMTTVAQNGYDGVQINPRWASNIFYNCQLPPCTVLEWIDTSAGKGDWYDLLAIEKATNTRHLLGLHHDAFMFHQANLNYMTAPETTINNVTDQYSLIQAWVEIVIQEMIRLVKWPIISQKFEDFSKGFSNRMARDACSPKLTWTTNAQAQTITGVTLTTNGNTCNAQIPLTVPGLVVSTNGFTTEQIGSDPLTIWVTMSGSPVDFTLSPPIPF